jgi:hypothetical protein
MGHAGLEVAGYEYDGGNKTEIEGAHREPPA